MKNIYLLAIAALVLASCDNGDNPNPSSGAMRISATIGGSTLSRASDNSWNNGDEIGISSTVGGVSGPYTNLKYTASKKDVDTFIFSGSDIFFYNSMALTAYYPFNGTEGHVPGTDGIITADTSPVNQTEDKQPFIDFLWDSKTGVDKKDFSAADRNVNFTFAHKMSKITFTFQSSDPTYDPKNPDKMISDGVDVATMISYNIEGLGVEGTFNTATGVCALDESKGRDGIVMTFSKVTSAEKMEEREFPSLIVFPQTKPEDGYTLHITTDELNNEGAPGEYVHQNYKCALRFKDDEIKAGYHYKFTIKVTKLGLIVGEVTIVPWSEEEKFVVATIDGDEAFKD